MLRSGYDNIENKDGCIVTCVYIFLRPLICLNKNLICRWAIKILQYDIFMSFSWVNIIDKLKNIITIHR